MSFRVTRTAGVYIQDLFKANDWLAISAIASESFGVHVHCNALRLACQPFCDVDQRNPTSEIGFTHDWSDGTWLLFLKTRLCEMGMFPHSGADSEDSVVTARFHFFFTHLEETEEMLILLRKNKFHLVDETLARSKIRSYMLKRGL